LLYIPNAGHELGEMPKLLGTLEAFTLATAAGKTLPQITWDYRELPGGLQLTMTSAVAPSRVVVWTATSATRDFRSVQWTSQDVRVEDGHYRYNLARPQTGYAAVFGEFSYTDGGQAFSQSTMPRIIGAKQDTNANVGEDRR
jgi:PhoPQ-activated pathogenicity-related protein